ncbi:hypothetical protein F2P56_034843 [Juglans regia]|uniref:Core Histone H2A/H2B/H3 domain-containing protein n=2 Tax=Juglans regia TaxID=51240 RepID=A0A833TV76_JUGRE|nr:probable histone H2B.1 [Juglans regia]KAF5442154.1 hypothetical protein F2P56_034843 [Juglans regia]
MAVLLYAVSGVPSSNQTGIVTFIVYEHQEDNVLLQYSGGYALCQSHYDEKMLLKFQQLGIKEANTPYDSSFKLTENASKAVAQLEYASAIAPKAKKKPTEKKRAEEKKSTVAKKSPTEKKPKAGKKLPKKGAVGASNKKKKQTNKSVKTNKIYIFKVLKQVHLDIEISSKAMVDLNNFINEIFEKLAQEASRLVRYNKKPTITSWEIQIAMHLVLPGELSKHAVSEGTKVVTKFPSS